ncbi:HvfB family MNIO-type RiPP peptide maturase [Chryseobacterium sp. Marseille-Q8038]
MVGIGYRKEFSKTFLNTDVLEPDFVEVAPENWLGVGGYWKRELKKVLEKYPLYCHGLSLSVGSPEGIDKDFVKQVKQFLEDTQAVLYSEHLTFSKVDNAHLYDLLPIPFTQDAIERVSENILQVQDILKRPLILENGSYYTVLEAEMSEEDFINEIVNRTGCELLLDVNNVYVNAFNFKYDAEKFIQSMPLDKVKYIHIAGHYKVNDYLIIDTHGEDIIDPVYKLLAWAIEKIGKDIPVLLERDFNIPELENLQFEIDTLKLLKNEILTLQLDTEYGQ